MKYLLIATALWLTGCTSQKIYVVRHAEKAVVTKDSVGMSASNPPLSDAGKVRALNLRDELKDKKINHIYSTNYIRTTSTAQPLVEFSDLPLRTYMPSKDSTAALLNTVKTLKGNVLIVGHSNTVDDLVNGITGRTDVAGDLPDTVYDNLYIITKKRNKWLFKQTKYGYPSNP